MQNLKESVTSFPAVHEIFKKVTQVERKPPGNLHIQKETECQKWLRCRQILIKFTLIFLIPLKPPHKETARLGWMHAIFYQIFNKK